MSTAPNIRKNPLAEAISKIERFSPAPRILAKAMSLLRDPNSSVEDVSALIKTDAALTSQIIRGANSAFYGAGGRVASLDEAVQKIGFGESVRLVNLFVTQVISSNGLNCYGISAEAFWTECLFNGIFMEELARLTNAAEMSEAHTAGLLRYIGRLAIDQSIKELGYGIFWDGSVPLSQWEKENVGFWHTSAAGLLLRAWKFSDPMIYAIEFQDHPDRSPQPSWLADALHFTATLLAPGVPLGVSGATLEFSIPELKETNFTTQYRLTLEMAENLVDTSFARFKSIRADLLK